MTTAHGVSISPVVLCSKVILSGVNGKVIMSRCRDDNPEEAMREAARSYPVKVSSRADGDGGGDGVRSQ